MKIFVIFVVSNFPITKKHSRSCKNKSRMRCEYCFKLYNDPKHVEYCSKGITQSSIDFEEDVPISCVSVSKEYESISDEEFYEEISKELFEEFEHNYYKHTSSLGNKKYVDKDKIDQFPKTQNNLVCKGKSKNERILSVIIEKLQDENWENNDLIDNLKGSVDDKLNQILNHFNYTDLDHLVENMDLECPICYEFTQNIVQPCLHKVCSSCVHKLKKNMYSCPICREEIY